MTNYTVALMYDKDVARVPNNYGGSDVASMIIPVSFITNFDKVVRYSFWDLNDMFTEDIISILEDYIKIMGTNYPNSPAFKLLELAKQCPGAKCMIR